MHASAYSGSTGEWTIIGYSEKKLVGRVEISRAHIKEKAIELSKIDKQVQVC